MNQDQQEFTEALAKLIASLPKGKFAEVIAFKPQVGFGDHDAGNVTALVISSTPEDLARAKQVIGKGICASQEEYGLASHFARKMSEAEPPAIFYPGTGNG